MLKHLTSKIVDSSHTLQEQIDWLFDDRTIQQAAQLKASDLKKFTAALRGEGYKVGDINDFKRQVRQLKKQGDDLSHIDIAQIFINGDQQYNQKPAKNRIMFARSAWHVYQNGLWATCESWLIELELQQLLKEIENKFAHSYTNSAQKSILAFIQQRVTVDDEILDSNENWLNVQNGVYDLENHVLIPHKPKQYLTRQLNVIYDKKAKSTLWEQFKQQVIGKYNDAGKWEPDFEAIAFLRECAGYSLTTNVKYEFMVWCLGEGKNGKGVLFHVLKTMAGSSAMSINLNTLKTNTYQLAMISGKTMLLCTEADKNVDIANDGDIKAIVSGEPVMVRQIRKEPFVLESKAKIWWSFNNAPNVRDSSEGFWRRIRVIPFNRQFDEMEADKDLKHKLTEPEVLSAIFNDVIAAYNNVQRSGYFTKSELVDAQTEEYKKEENAIQTFVEDCCQVEQGETVSSSDLYTTYKDWCNKNGYQPFSIKNFKREMHRLKIYDKRLSTGIQWIDLKLKNSVQSNMFNIP